ncbi:MAG: MarR family transcriptional regulator, partial [Nocardioidaceae bacterium]
MTSAEVEAVQALARMSRVLERATGDLNLAQYRVLSAVAAGHARASRVASRLALGRPTVSASVESLCRRRLLERERTAEDQRGFTLTVTPAGAALLEEIEAEMATRLRHLTART